MGVSVLTALVLVASVAPKAALHAQETKSLAAVSKVPTAPAKPPRRAAAAHIVISYKGAPRAQQFPGVSRSKEEARALAEKALVEARKPESKFAAVVAQFTDDPQGKATGGNIGIAQRGQFGGPFEALGNALFGMEVGQVSDIVETPFGFHIVTREPIVEYSASHILIQYKGGGRAKPTVTRTKEEAKKLCEEVTAKAKAPGADFAELAKQYSDGPSGPRGGKLGVFGPGQMVPPFEKALAALDIGGVAGPVETEFGYHVILRTPIDRVGASHILLQYKGSERAKPDVTRTKEEAKAAAEKLVEECRKPGADFGALAKEHSDGPSGPNGGDLGLFERGRMVPAFDAAVFNLKVGQVSGVVETPFGYHVILRTE